jgi:hypothetical protein
MTLWELAKFTEVRLKKFLGDYGTQVVPVLPAIGFMFVHWDSDEDENDYEWSYFYHVPTNIKNCTCCAYCWRKYSRGCIQHYQWDDWRLDKKPVAIHGSLWDMMELVNDESKEKQEEKTTQPRRSERTKKQTQFYYGC